MNPRKWTASETGVIVALTLLAGVVAVTIDHAIRSANPALLTYAVGVALGLFTGFVAGRHVRACERPEGDYVP